MSITFAKKILSTRSLLINQRRYGYVVLVPEIGEDLPNKNPLLRSDGLPEFSNITIENCLATIGRQALEVEKTVQTVGEEITKADGNVNILNDVIKPLDESDVQLQTTWGLAKVLYLGNSSLMPTKSYMAIHDRACKAKFTKFVNAPILKSMSNARKNNDSGISDVECRLLDKYILEGKLNGVHLDEKKKAILTHTTIKLRDERSKFQEKLDISISEIQPCDRRLQHSKGFPDRFTPSHIYQSDKSVKRTSGR
ncbi:hypothetical protein HA402_008727 [Bradysia odoriphaga]|nr:hypothetical protein HA402_008727 [Bradysia odoriphaga]